MLLSRGEQQSLSPPMVRSPLNWCLPRSTLISRSDCRVACTVRQRFCSSHLSRNIMHLNYPTFLRLHTGWRVSLIIDGLYHRPWIAPRWLRHNPKSAPHARRSQIDYLLETQIKISRSTFWPRRVAVSIFALLRSRTCTYPVDLDRSLDLLSVGVSLELQQ